MSTITLAILAKWHADEFQRLVDDGLRFCQQVVVAVDEAAVPGIADYRAPLVRYIYRTLAGDFAAQRNALVEAAECDWVLHLDTDEQIDLWLWRNLRAILDGVKEDLVLLPRRTVFMDRPEIETPWPDWQPKLHRKHVRWQYKVHEWPANASSQHSFPMEDRYAIRHCKTTADQEVANQLYATISR